MANETDDVDREKLAALRPGMPASALEAALGALWRPPAPHQQGAVDAVRNSHGFRARIDAEGIIGEVGYDYRFDPRVAVDGLHLGMTAEEVVRARPDLVLPPEQNGWRIPSLTLPGGVRWFVTVTLGTVNAMEFRDPAAIYPEKQPFAYPAPAGEPGAPFRDPNLKLAVLSSLLDERAIDLDTPEALVAHVEGRPFDDEVDSYAFNAAAYDYLCRYPLTEDLLGRVRSLLFDGGNSAYPYAYLDWDGETDHFDVTDLDGIAACPEIRSFHCVALLDEVDLRQLGALPRLETVKIAVPCTHLEALLDLPALKTCSLMSDGRFAEATTAGHPTREVLDTLKARGVRIRVHWMTHSSDDGPPPPAFT